MATWHRFILVNGILTIPMLLMPGGAMAQASDEEVCNAEIERLCGGDLVGQCFEDDAMWQKTASRCEGHIQTVIEMEREALAQETRDPAHHEGRESAADFVRSFYQPGQGSLGMFDPQLQHRFGGAALDALVANDKAQEKGDGPCIDFDPVTDSQDFDQAEIDRTLVLETQDTADGAVVTATFKRFGEPATILWTLESGDGSWSVLDIESETGGWTLSELGCGN